MVVAKPRLGDSVRIKSTPGLQDRGRGQGVESAGLNHMDTSSAEARDITASLGTLQSFKQQFFSFSRLPREAPSSAPNL